jgi:hypothetical protein
MVSDVDEINILALIQKPGNTHTCGLRPANEA